MKDKVKILVCKNYESLIHSCSAASCAEITPFEFGDTGLIEKIAYLQPDLVFLDLFMPKLDAIDIISAYTAVFGHAKPYFTVLCPFVSPRLKEELKRCGANKILLRPYSSCEISEVIMQEYRHKMINCMWNYDASIVSGLHEAYRSRDTEAIVAEILREFCVRPQNPGYEFLKRAVVLAVKDERMMYSVTRQLYPTIAREMGTTASGVERRIRHAITVAWQSCNQAVIEEYFGNTVDNLRGKPANSEFIAMMADRIRLNMRSVQKIRAV